MSEMLRIWKGEGYNKNAQLQLWMKNDFTTHYIFIDRLGRTAGNPTEEEAQEIIKRWHLIEA